MTNWYAESVCGGSTWEGKITLALMTFVPSQAVGLLLCLPSELPFVFPVDGRGQLCRITFFLGADLRQSCTLPSQLGDATSEQRCFPSIAGLVVIYFQPPAWTVMTAWVFCAPFSWLISYEYWGRTIPYQTNRLQFAHSRDNLVRLVCCSMLALFTHPAPCHSRE